MGGCPPGWTKRSLISQGFFVSSFWVGEIGPENAHGQPPREARELVSCYDTW